MRDDAQIARINAQIGGHAKQFRREVELWLEEIRLTDASGSPHAKAAIRDRLREMAEVGDLGAVIAAGVLLGLVTFNDATDEVAMIQ